MPELATEEVEYWLDRIVKKSEDIMKTIDRGIAEGWSPQSIREIVEMRISSLQKNVGYIREELPNIHDRTSKCPQ